MKVLPIFLLTFCACFVLFFYASHHRRNDNPFQSTTLGQIYWELFSDLPEIISPRALWFFLLALAGIASSFYPAIFVLMTRWASPGAGQPGGALFIFGGLIAAAGAFANLVAILVSHMSFGCGSGYSTRDQTAFCWILPL